MNNRKSHLILAVTSALAIAFTATPSFGESDGAHLAGSWMGAVAPTSPPGLTPFTSLITFTSDGSVIESRRLFVPASPLGPLMETAGHGAWTRIDDREFDIHFVFLLQGAVSGVDIGTDNVHLRLRLDSTGAVLSGTFESTIKDTSGNPIFTASGIYRPTPIWRGFCRRPGPSSIRGPQNSQFAGQCFTHGHPDNGFRDWGRRSGSPGNRLLVPVGRMRRRLAGTDSRSLALRQLTPISTIVQLRKRNEYIHAA